MRIRLADVARQAGVSSATASMALRGARGIAPATAERVRRAALALGYTPDQAAQAMARSGNRAGQGTFYGTLAVLTNAFATKSKNVEDSKWSGADALKEAASELGYAIDRFPLPQTVAAATLVERQLKARNVQGVIIEACNLPIPEVGFPWEHFATMVISASADETRLNFINSHTATQTHVAVHQGYRRGYRRFGILVDMNRFPDWMGGFDMAIFRLGLRDASFVLDMPDWDEEVFLAWFERHRPEMIVANEDNRPVSALARLGLSPPKDFGYCCLDIFPNMPTLSGFVHPRAIRNRLAVEMLHGLLRRKEFGIPSTPLAIGLGAHWREGQTLRPLPME